MIYNYTLSSCEVDKVDSVMLEAFEVRIWQCEKCAGIHGISLNVEPRHSANRETAMCSGFEGLKSKKKSSGICSHADLDITPKG